MSTFTQEKAATKEGIRSDDDAHALDDLDEDGVVSTTVPSKYRGTITDKKDMQTLGKVQVLRVSEANPQLAHHAPGVS